MVTGEGLCKHLYALKQGHLLSGIWLIQRWHSSLFVARKSCTLSSQGGSYDTGTYLHQNKSPCPTEAASAKHTFGDL